MKDNKRVKQIFYDTVVCGQATSKHLTKWWWNIDTISISTSNFGLSCTYPFFPPKKDILPQLQLVNSNKNFMVNRLVSYHLYAVAALSESFLAFLSQHKGRHNPNSKEFTKLNIGLKVERKKEN